MTELVAGLPFLSGTADVFQCDTRALAHPSETSVLCIENLWDVKFSDFAIV